RIHRADTESRGDSGKNNLSLRESCGSRPNGRVCAWPRQILRRVGHLRRTNGGMLSQRPERTFCKAILGDAVNTVVTPQLRLIQAKTTISVEKGDSRFVTAVEMECCPIMFSRCRCFPALACSAGADRPVGTLSAEQRRMDLPEHGGA